MLMVAGCSGSGPVFDGSAFPEPHGETRALVLFVRFQDDEDVYLNPITQSAREWARPDDLPVLARTVVARSVLRPTGLTEYFLTQSEGRFRLTGSSFPRVLVTAEPEATYRRPNGTLDQARLTRELLQVVDRELDLESFDADRDGYLDYLFVVLRRSRIVRLYPSHASGVSDLGYSSTEPEFGKRRRLRVDRDANGSYVRWDDSGNIFAEVDLIRLMAHEIGHDLWRDWVHLRPVAPLAGVPPVADRPVGYALMAGDGDARGDETISAFERDHLGWITCRKLQRDTVVVVRDLYSSGRDNCLTMEAGPLLPGSAIRTLYVSYRARIGPFDRLLHEDALLARSDQGLMDTGILVMATEPGGHVGPIPADGGLTLSAGHDAYTGDLFKPGQRLTPWTRPNSAGYLTYPPRGRVAPQVPSPEQLSNTLFQGLHVLEEAGLDGLTVRYVSDERREAQFLNGDIIPDIPGLRFEGPATLTGRVRLEGRATFPDGLRLGPDAELEVVGRLEASLLALAPGATLVVSGDARIDLATAGPGARVRLEPGGGLSGQGATLLLSLQSPDTP